jgi:hypothetical protein
MKQYLTVCGIAIIIAMIGTMTIENQNAMGKPSKPSKALPAVNVAIIGFP